MTQTDGWLGFNGILIFTFLLAQTVKISGGAQERLSPCIVYGLSHSLAIGGPRSYGPKSLKLKSFCSCTEIQTVASNIFFQYFNIFWNDSGGLALVPPAGSAPWAKSRI